MTHKLKKPSKILPNEEIVCGSCGGVVLAKNWNKHNEYHDKMDASGYIDPLDAHPLNKQ